MSLDLPFALGQASSGLPLLPTSIADLEAGMKGGAYTATFIDNQIVAKNFYAWLAAAGDEAWTASTDQAGNPVLFAAQKSDDNELYLLVQAVLDQDVLAGTQPPQPMTLDGNDYNIIASMTVTLSYDQTPMWAINIPVGIASRVGLPALANLAWQGVLAPLVTSLTKGIQACFSAAPGATTAPAIADAGTQAAQQAEVTGAQAGEDTVSLAVGVASMVGFVVVAAIPFIIQILAHASYQGLQIYNLTPYDITWDLAYPAHGALSLAPSAGNDEQPLQVIPATSTFTPPGSPPIPVASEALFGFASKSDLSGIGYVMTFTLTDPATGNTVDSATVLFDVPWAGKNSLYAATGTLDTSASDLYGTYAGKYQQTQYVASDATIKVTATFDYLSGTHPSPSGQDMYWYNSLLVFEPAG